MAKPTKSRAKQLLQKSLDAIPGLKQQTGGSPDFKKWQRDTHIAIEYIFEGLPSRTEDFDNIRYSPIMYTESTPKSTFQGYYVRGLESAGAVLESMIEEVEEYWDDVNQEQDSSKAREIYKKSTTSQVFVIHGRDQGTRDTVTRFLESLGIEPVILQEQPDQGRTVIEKFEQCVQGDFAVALFTPDDIGGTDGDDLQPRARQNVIFEFGYFIGKFGRDRVRVLVKGNPEIPSDYSGVIYIQLEDSGGWKMDLIREMKSAGFDIDANRAFEESL